MVEPSSANRSPPVLRQQLKQQSRSQTHQWIERRYFRYSWVLAVKCPHLTLAVKMVSSGWDAASTNQRMTTTRMLDAIRLFNALSRGRFPTYPAHRMPTTTRSALSERGWSGNGVNTSWKREA